MSALLQFPLNRKFGPERTRVMGEAFDVVCEYMKHGGRDDLDSQEMRDLAALKIIEKAAAGVTDPFILANYAITFIRK